MEELTLLKRVSLLIIKRRALKMKREKLTEDMDRLTFGFLTYMSGML